MREMSVKGIVELVNSMPPAPVLVQRIIARIVKAAARFGMCIFKVYLPMCLYNFFIKDIK